MATVGPTPAAGGNVSESDSGSDSGSDTSRDLDEATSDADEGDSDNDNHMDEPPAKRQKQEEVDAVWNDKSAGLRLISADHVVFHVPAYHLQSARCVEPGMGLGT